MNPLNSTRRRQVLIFSLAALSALAWPSSGGAETLLIRNVKFDGDGWMDAVVTVNLLIVGGKLEIVTRDVIRADKADRALDANEGFLLGNLDVGESASFLIFNKNPKDNVEIILDTATHASFAIHEGVIIKNTLARLNEEPNLAAGTKKAGWLTYTPPPMALPSTYKDTGKWNRWQTRPISGIFIGVVGLDHMKWFHQDNASEGQVGNLDDFNGGEVRGFRLGSVGTFNFAKPWIYTVFFETVAFDRGFRSGEAGDFVLFDLRLDIPIGGIGLSLGLMKEPISLDRITSFLHMSILERSAAADGLLPARNVGAVLNGVGFGRRMSWAGGVFNDWLQEGQAFDNSASQGIGRVTGLPWMSEDEIHLVHVGMSARISDAKEGFRFRTEPEFNLSPDFVDTEPQPADRHVTFDLEVMLRGGPFLLSAEYLHTNVASPEIGSPSFNGFYLTGSWMITGEIRPYNRRSGVFGSVKPAKTVYQKGKGAWELAARWSRLDLNSGAIAGGEVEIKSIGFNWWLTPLFQFGMNYRYITNDRFGVVGHSGGLMSRVMLMLE